MIIPLLLCADADSITDVETGQTSELVAIAEATSSTYAAIDANSWHPDASDASYEEKSSPTELRDDVQKLTNICTAIQRHKNISSDLRTACEALLEINKSDSFTSRQLLSRG